MRDALFETLESLQLPAIAPVIKRSANHANFKINPN
jgi:hypothetical protein